MKTFICNSSDENAVVFDGFMGSGSTGVACVNTGRNFIGIELDKDYFAISKKRIEENEQESNCGAKMTNAEAEKALMKILTSMISIAMIFMRGSIL